VFKAAGGGRGTSTAAASQMAQRVHQRASGSAAAGARESSAPPPRRAARAADTQAASPASPPRRPPPHPAASARQLLLELGALGVGARHAARLPRHVRLDPLVAEPPEARPHLPHVGLRAAGQLSRRLHKPPSSWTARWPSCCRAQQRGSSAAAGTAAQPTCIVAMVCLGMALRMCGRCEAAPSSMRTCTRGGGSGGGQR
jgi:hypothetical protein